MQKRFEGGIFPFGADSVLLFVSFSGLSSSLWLTADSIIPPPFPSRHPLRLQAVKAS